MVGWICSPESEARHLQGSGFACHVGSVGCAGKTMAQASQMLEAHPPQALSSRVPASNSGSALAIGLQRGKKASPTILMLSLKLPGPAGQRGRRREEGRGGVVRPRWWFIEQLGAGRGKRQGPEAGRPVRGLPRGAEQVTRTTRNAAGRRRLVRGPGFSHVRPCTRLGGGRRWAEFGRQPSGAARGSCWDGVAHVGAAS